MFQSYNIHFRTLNCTIVHIYTSMDHILVLSGDDLLHIAWIFHVHISIPLPFSLDIYVYIVFVLGFSLFKYIVILVSSLFLSTFIIHNFLFLTTWVCHKTGSEGS